MSDAWCVMCVTRDVGCVRCVSVCVYVYVYVCVRVYMSLPLAPFPPVVLRLDCAAASLDSPVYVNCCCCFTAATTAWVL